MHEGFRSTDVGESHPMLDGTAGGERSRRSVRHAGVGLHMPARSSSPGPTAASQC